MSATPKHFPPRPRLRGFTLVEIMVVVVLIGLIAGLAFPTILRSRTNARSARFINDLRQACAVFQAHVLENGTYPDDGMPGEAPAGMEDALAPIKWTQPTAIGGQWDWDFNQFGFTAGVSVYLPELTRRQMAAIDGRIDDGNLATGVFQERGSGYIYVIE